MTTATHRRLLTCTDVFPGTHRVRPLLLKYKGHYELKFSNNFHGRKTWNIQGVTVTQPGPERALQHRIDGSAIAGSPFESWCGDTAKAGRVGGMTIVK